MGSSLLVIAFTAPSLLASLLVTVACVIYFRRIGSSTSLMLMITAVARLAVSVAEAFVALIRARPSDLDALMHYSPGADSLASALSVLGWVSSFLFSVALAVLLLSLPGRGATGVTDAAE